MTVPVPRILIVVPCYNEEAVLPETCSRLSELLARLVASGKVAASSAICFVDDGSRDATWRLITGFTARGDPVEGLRLSRNRGHQNALLAGLLHARADAVVSIDADLQDDVDAIEAMVDHYREGCDVVYGVRRERTSDSAFKRLTAEVFYRLMTVMGAETVFNHADFRLTSARVLAALQDFREVNLYLRGIVPLIGFRSAMVEYERSARFAGESKYPLHRMFALAADAITSFSVVPLRLISIIGLMVFMGSMGVTAWALWAALVTRDALPGWASTVLPMYFLGGVQLLALGVIGEYLGKLYVEAKARPRFVIAETVGYPVRSPHAQAPAPAAHYASASPQTHTGTTGDRT
jgi:glycosyltransferase involved in cell wall biosynthesis